MLLKIPVIQISIYFSNVQTLAAVVSVPELEVLRQVHANVLDESLIPTDNVMTLDDENGASGEGDTRTVQDEWMRLERHYGIHPEKSQTYAVLAYPGGLRDFKKACAEAAKATEMKKAKA